MTPYIGEILAVAFSFPPPGWLVCDGSILSIAENDVLFNLIGTTYGGDGVNTFAIPDLRGRVPVHQGQGPGLSAYAMGQQGGQANVTLTSNQLPVHSHQLNCSDAAGGSSAQGQYFGSPSSSALYTTTPGTAVMGDIVDPSGGSQPHDMQPYQTILYIIATDGIYPSQS